MNDNIQNAVELLQSSEVDRQFVRQVEFMVDDGCLQKLPQAIITNFTDVYSALLQMTENDRTLIVTDENRKECEDRCALLNKQIANIEAQRKDIKKAWNVPYAAFEADCKKLVALLTSAKDNLWGQIKAADDAEKSDKETLYRSYYEAHAGKILPYRSYAQIADPKWLSKGKKKEAVFSEIDQKIMTIIEELDAICDLCSEFETALLAKYKDGASVIDVVLYNNRLKAEKQALEAKKKADEKTVIEEKKPPQTAENQAETANGDEEEKVYPVDIRIYATKSQLAKLKSFFHAHGIRFCRCIDC